MLFILAVCECFFIENKQIAEVYQQMIGDICVQLVDFLILEVGGRNRVSAVWKEKKVLKSFLLDYA